MPSDDSDSDLPLMVIRSSKRGKQTGSDDSSEVTSPAKNGKRKKARLDISEKGSEVRDDESDSNSNDVKVEQLTNKKKSPAKKNIKIMNAAKANSHSDSDEEPLMKNWKSKKNSEIGDSKAKPGNKSPKKVDERIKSREMVSDDSESSTDGTNKLNITQKNDENLEVGQRKSLEAMKQKVAEMLESSSSSDGEKADEEKQKRAKEDEGPKKAESAEKMKENLAKMLTSSSSDRDSDGDIEEKGNAEKDNSKVASGSVHDENEKTDEKNTLSRNDLKTKINVCKEKKIQADEKASVQIAKEKSWKSEKNKKSNEGCGDNDSDLDSDSDVGTSNATKETTEKKEEDLSDTSIDKSIDKNGEDSVKKCKKDEGDSDEKKRKSKKRRGKEKPMEDSKAQYLKRLKHLVVLAGLRFNYKKMFDGVEDDKKRINLLKQALTDKGVTTLSVEGCKSFRLKREEEQELAELSRNRIIEPEITTRVTRASRRAEQERKVHRVARLSTSSSETDSETEKIREENVQIFSRLKGIVSDESDSN